MNIVDLQRVLSAGKYKTTAFDTHTTYVVKLENGCSISLLYVNNKFKKYVVDGKEELVKEIKKIIEDIL
jgi:predicted acetyltransferase